MQQGNSARSAAPSLIGNSPQVDRLSRQIDLLGSRRCTVLLQGESGTGKELAARLIHHRGARAAGPFIPVDCTALRDTLLESQLFGHTRGAFTGADKPTLGFFRAADGGTLFLDEIGELPLPSQAKLLRCIQEGVVTPLGATTGVAVNVRVVAATHRDLSDMVKRGEFRLDLYYRLNVACLRLPPLRQRLDDIPLLVEKCLRDLAATYNEPMRRMTRGAMDALMRYDWPGNIRELLNAIEHGYVFSPGLSDLDVHDLPVEVIEKRSAEIESCSNDEPQITTLAIAERNLIAAALNHFEGNQSRAAEALAIERHRLRRRIRFHGLTDLVRARR